MPTERTESEGFYEMLWDCDHCGQKGLLGKSQRHCGECGAPENPTKRYFPSPEQQQRVEGHIFEGSDRACPACSAPMGAKAKNCTQCGSPLDGSKEVASVEQAAPAPKRHRRIWPLVTLDFGAAGTCDVDDATWRKYADGATIKLEVRVRSGDVVCSSL